MSRFDYYCSLVSIISGSELFSTHYSLFRWFKRALLSQFRFIFYLKRNCLHSECLFACYPLGVIWQLIVAYWRVTEKAALSIRLNAWWFWCRPWFWWDPLFNAALIFITAMLRLLIIDLFIFNLVKCFIMNRCWCMRPWYSSWYVRWDDAEQLSQLVLVLLLIFRGASWCECLVSFWRWSKVRVISKGHISLFKREGMLLSNIWNLDCSSRTLWCDGWITLAKWCCQIARTFVLFFSSEAYEEL